MSNENVASFWNRNKKRIVEALSEGIDALASVMKEGADRFGFSQQIEGENIFWCTGEDRLMMMFCRVPDPRDIERISAVFLTVKQKQNPLTAVLVHQWTDGEGNWDAFMVTQHRALHHADRIYGTETIIASGPVLREDIYTLFACDQPFPEPGGAGWAELLDGPLEKVIEQLGLLASNHSCSYAVQGGRVSWIDTEGDTAAQFFVLPDPGNLDAFIDIYTTIKETACPISFVFLKSDQPRVYDIFRLSGRSFLEHHNQAKGVLKPTYMRTHATGNGANMLENLQWAPRWTSLIGCIKGCLDYLKQDVSDAWLFGATGHAFVLNISQGLCPSGPTAWDTAPSLALGRNIGYAVVGIDEYCPDKQNDLPFAQKQAWDYVRNAIDDGFPCFGWELQVPEYYVIYGYDETGYYISGPADEDGAGPIPWQT